MLKKPRRRQKPAMCREEAASRSPAAEEGSENNSGRGPERLCQPMVEPWSQGQQMPGAVGQCSRQQSCRAL